MDFEALVGRLCANLEQIQNEMERLDEQLRDEVLNLFRLEDLAGIEKLMAMRRQEAELFADVRSLLEKWTPYRVTSNHASTDQVQHGRPL